MLSLLICTSTLYTYNEGFSVSGFVATLSFAVASFKYLQPLALAAHRCATLPGWSLRVALHHRPTGYESVALLLSYRGIYHFNPSGQGTLFHYSVKSSGNNHWCARRDSNPQNIAPQATVSTRFDYSRIFRGLESSPQCMPMFPSHFENPKV